MVDTVVGVCAIVFVLCLIVGTVQMLSDGL